jgi:hypothetical protein
LAALLEHVANGFEGHLKASQRVFEGHLKASENSAFLARTILLSALKRLAVGFAVSVLFPY